MTPGPTATPYLRGSRPNAARRRTRTISTMKRCMPGRMGITSTATGGRFPTARRSRLRTDRRGCSTRPGRMVPKARLIASSSALEDREMTAGSLSAGHDLRSAPMAPALGAGRRALPRRRHRHSCRARRMGLMRRREGRPGVEWSKRHDGDRRMGAERRACPPSTVQLADQNTA